MELYNQAATPGRIVAAIVRSVLIRAYGRIDTVLASVESRRNAVLREIERRRESVASRLRKASNDVIDGEFTEHRPAESIEEQSADQAALGVADHRATRDAA
jgi:hypothetical protein